MGDLWILGMPFFRKYYTTFHFSYGEGTLPKAAKMSFSQQDGKCRPGSPPVLARQSQGKGKTSAIARQSIGDVGTSAPRRAQLKVDMSSILIPHVLRNAERHRA